MHHRGQTAEVEDQRQELRAQAGKWLRAVREDRNLSQRDLAEKIGVLYYTFVSQIESGRGRIPPERYESWATALGLDPKDFSIKMLSFYEPTTYSLIFGSKE